MILFLKGLPALLSFLLAHPIHVSVTEIEYDREDRALEIMMRVFADDLELTLRKAFNEPALDVLHRDHAKTVDNMMARYLARHLLISLDGKRQILRYLGHEIEGDAFVFFVEVPDVGVWNTIQIRNDVIMETYGDQSNIVHVYVGEEVRSDRLTARKPVTRLSFQ